MKLASFPLLLAFRSLVAAHALANPAADADVSPALEKRTACEVSSWIGIQSWPGTCVDTRQGGVCKYGLLVKGWCPGPNYVICCIEDQCLGLAPPLPRRD
jgi:hypothetical protein